MLPDDLEAPLRVSSLLRREVRDDQGRVLGRVADVETRRDGAGREQIVAVIVTAGRWGRLLGYERDQRTGPWLLEQLARRVLRRRLVRVSWRDLPW
jgi:sporulation protein YlmC with PRC-barrel domain